MQSLYLKIKRKFVFDSIKSFYTNGSYELVLKYLQKPYSMKRDLEVFCNIFRMISLKEMEKSEWKLEYEYFLEEGFLEIFSEDEKRYLACYLKFHLFDEKTLLPDIDNENISKRVRKYFPFPT